MTVTHTNFHSRWLIMFFCRNRLPLCSKQSLYGFRKGINLPIYCQRVWWFCSVHLCHLRGDFCCDVLPPVICCEHGPGIYSIFGIMANAISFNLYREILYVLRKNINTFLCVIPSFLIHTQTKWFVFNVLYVYMFLIFCSYFLYMFWLEKMYFHIGIVTLHFWVTL